MLLGNFQFRGVLIILTIVGQKHTVLAVSAGGCCAVIFNDILHMSFLAGTHVFKAYPAYTTTKI